MACATSSNPSDSDWFSTDSSFSDGENDSGWGISSREGQAPSSRCATVRAKRQRSPGPRCYPISRGRRKIIFLERDGTGRPGLPVIRLDPSLERHVLHRRIRSGPCPQHRRYYGHIVSLLAVKLGALRGCPLCIITFFAITEFSTQDLHTNMRLDDVWSIRDQLTFAFDQIMLYSAADDPSQVAQTLPVDIGGPWRDSGATICNFYGKLLPLFRVNKEFVHSSSPLTCAKIALRWLQECDLKHLQCGNPAQQLPMRLIDVASCRLIEQDRSIPAADNKLYACLSHCWGAGDQAKSVLRTTKSTLASYKESLPLERLPRTFRDAIDFTRALGIPYLWIDSLCIIQDDKLDWEREAAKMAAIYTNCYVTIAASASSNADGGLFPRQDIGTCKVGTLCCHDRPFLPVYIRKEPAHYPQATDYALSQRAWVLQETLLSPRTLYFLGPEIMFECHEGMQCQCGITDQKACVKRRDLTTSVSWGRTLFGYARTSLTFSRDTLPALSGLATQWLTTHPTDRYLAGLWRSNLVQGLIWSASPVQLGTRVRPWRAPSWSWASVTATDADSFCVNYFDYAPGIAAMVEVVHAHCAPSGADPTGTVAFGHLILRGKAFDATIYYDHGEHLDTSTQSTRYTAVVLSDIVIRCMMDFISWRPGRDYIPHGTNVKLLLIHGPTEITEANRSSWTCLILKPLFGETFERIGIVLGPRQIISPYADGRASAFTTAYQETPVADYMIV